jgi:hypothetical protein
MCGLAGGGSGPWAKLYFLVEGGARLHGTGRRPCCTPGLCILREVQCHRRYDTYGTGTAIASYPVFLALASFNMKCASLGRKIGRVRLSKPRTRSGQKLEPAAVVVTAFPKRDHPFVAGGVASWAEPVDEKNSGTAGCACSNAHIRGGPITGRGAHAFVTSVPCSL